MTAVKTRLLQQMNYKCRNLLIQVALKIFASGFGFFAHKFEVFDATIVVLSWIIDVASE